MTDTSSATTRTQRKGISVPTPPFLTTTAGGVTPAIDWIDGKPGPQRRDEETGLPIWNLRAWDPEATAGRGQDILEVKVVSQFQPELPLTLPNLPHILITLENLTMSPYVNRQTNRLGMSWWSTGIRPALKGKAGE